MTLIVYTNWIMIKWILSLLALVNVCVAHPSSSSTSSSSTRGTSTASTTKATTSTTATATSTTLFGEFKAGEILTEVDGLYVYNVTSHTETEAQFTSRAGEAFIQKWGLHEAYEKMLSEQPPAVSDYSESISNGIDKMNTLGHLGPYEDVEWESWMAAGMTVEQKYNLKRSDLASRPNILHIMVDDLGTNDINLGEKDSTNMPWATPAITKIFRDEGVDLTRYYSQPYCTPARGSYLTGKNPDAIGMFSSTSHIPLKEATIAQEMKSAGYDTSIIGKWGVGWESELYTPSERGFDYSLGYYSLAIDKQAYTLAQNVDIESLSTAGYTGDFVDWWENGVYKGDEVKDNSNEFDQVAFRLASAAVDKIEGEYKDSNTPWYMYLALDLVHTPFIAPTHYTDICESVMTPTVTLPTTYSDDLINRCGLILMLDEVVANITCALEASGQWDDTLIVFTSDNGGNYQGSTYPFLGGKFDGTEGGIRVPGALGGGYLAKTAENMVGSVYDGLFHVTDWIPTLMDVATGSEWTGSYLGTDNDLTGVNQWQALKQSTSNDIVTDVASPRTNLMAFYEPVAATNTTAAYNASIFIFKQVSTGSYYKFNLNLETFPAYDVLAEYSIPDVVVNYQCTLAGGNNIYDTASTRYGSSSTTYSDGASKSRSSTSNYIAQMELRASVVAEANQDRNKTSGTSFAMHIAILSGLLMLLAGGGYVMYKSYSNGKYTTAKGGGILDQSAYHGDYGTYLEERDAESDPLL